MVLIFSKVIIHHIFMYVVSNQFEKYIWIRM